MSYPRRVFLVGGSHTPFIGKGHPDFIWKGHPDFGQRQNPSITDYCKSIVLQTLEATASDPSLIDRLYIGNFCGELFESQGHLNAAVIGAHPALQYKPSMRLEAACASGGLALLCSIDAIQAGADVVMAVGAEVQTTVSARQGGEYLARASHFARQRSIDDFTFPALFARRIKANIEEGLISRDDLAHVSVKAYGNANKNPLAHMRAKKITVEWASTASESNPAFLSNKELAPYLLVSDCSQVSDGASGAVLVSEEGLHRLGKHPSDAVEILGHGHAVASLFEDPNPLAFHTTAFAAAKAYAATGLGPSDIQVAEVHDCFTIAEMLMYEAVGFAPSGGARRLVQEGTTQIGGRIPVNTGGGLIGFGHPVGATGVKQAVEIFRQLKGLCGDYQVSGHPTVGLTANMGGDDRTAVVLLYRNVQA
jgi:acetyl-CoA acyltransferase